MKKIIIFLTFILSCSKEYKPVLEIEIEKEGYKIKLLTIDGTLKEMENKVKFIVEPKPTQFKAYLYMPEMPGMPAMTQLFELGDYPIYSTYTLKFQTSRRRDKV